MKNSYSLEIEATPERVFRLLNNPDLAMKWVPNLVEDEVIVETPDNIGTTFRQVFVERGTTMEMTGEITEYKDNEC